MRAGYTYIMKKGHIPLIGIYVLLPAAVLLACVFAVLLVRQEHTRRMGDLEYRSFQILTGVLEQYRETEHFNSQVWPEVKAFGLYNFSGSPVYLHGPAPRLINPRDVSLRGKTERSGSSLMLLRLAGTVPGPPESEVPGTRRGFMSRKYSFIYVEIDVSLMLAKGEFSIYFCIFC